ncbi:MAG: hypothetical protein JW818_06330 [Pirellulales bacterium]|nr:hypothetical protein [Pirellulales bacterium]
MTNVLLYWRDYRKNVTGDYAGWHSNSALLGRLQPGDRLWLVTSGKSLGHEAEQAGFLVAVWQVAEAIENPGDEPAYPRDQYRFRVVPDGVECITLNEPILVDHILRPAHSSKAVSIGRYLQGPRKLDESTVRRLRVAAGPDLAIKWLKGNRAWAS